MKMRFFQFAYSVICIEFHLFETIPKMRNVIIISNITVFILIFLLYVDSGGFSLTIDDSLKGCLSQGPIDLDQEMSNIWVTGIANCFSSQQSQCDHSNIFYTADGSCNNLKYPNWGKASTPYCRLAKANYVDGFFKMTPTKTLPREIRTSLFPTREDVLTSCTNMFFVSLGQFVTHDIGLSRPTADSKTCCPEDVNPVSQNEYDLKCSAILIPDNDYYYSMLNPPIKCVNLRRLENTLTLGCDIKPIIQINDQTPQLDLSIVYGRNINEVQQLRAKVDGLLAVANFAETNDQEYPQILHGAKNCPIGGLSADRCMAGGDIRVNQNPEIFAVYSLFLRLHNLVARTFKQAFFDWDDETLYQWSRKVTTGVYQNAFDEYLQAYIGSDFQNAFSLSSIDEGYEEGYNEDLIPQVLVEFQGSAGRCGHSMNLGTLKYDKQLNKSYSLRDVLFNIGFVTDKDSFLGLIQAYVSQRSQVLNEYFTEDFVDLLKMPQTSPLQGDLSALDIIRGHDFGIQPANVIRELFGLPRINDFDELYDHIRNSETNVPLLKSIYNSIDEVELYVFGLLEINLPDAVVGPTLASVIAQTFYQLKHSDRFWHSFESSGLTLAQLDYIRRIKFSDVICLTTSGLTEVPTNAFLIPCDSNPMKRCNEVQQLDFSWWLSG